MSGSSPPFLFRNMNHLQSHALALVVQGRNIFLTGPAGTGKTYTIRAIIDHAQKAGWAHGVTATTGAAALLIGGSTLHSFLGIGLGAKDAADLAQGLLTNSKKKPIVARLRALRLLIIDEISMLSNVLFTKVSSLLSILRNTDAPFGGVQLVLCGDFCQLPPVEPDYAFLCEEWDRCELQVVHLTQSFRHDSDTAFQEVLTGARWAQLAPTQVDSLRALTRRSPPSNGIQPTRLFALNKDVDRINDAELARLIDTGKETREYTTRYSSKEAEGWADACNVPRSVKFAVGAQVVLTRNIDPEAGLVNGSRGVVVALEEAGPVVRFTSGTTAVINAVTAEMEDGVKSHLRTTTKPFIVYTPLRLAYALTMHKSQGMTLDAVEIDLGTSVFSPGQAYTALSRARSLDSVWLSRFTPSAFKTDPEVVDFYAPYRN